MLTSVLPLLLALGMWPFLTMTLLWMGLPVDLIAEPPVGCVLPFPAMGLALFPLARPQSQVRPSHPRVAHNSLRAQLPQPKSKTSQARPNWRRYWERGKCYWLRVKAANQSVCCLTRGKRTIYYLQLCFREWILYIIFIGIFLFNKNLAY